MQEKLCQNRKICVQTRKFLSVLPKSSQISGIRGAFSGNWSQISGNWSAFSGNWGQFLRNRSHFSENRGLDSGSGYPDFPQPGQNPPHTRKSTSPFFFNPRKVVLFPVKKTHNFDQNLHFLYLGRENRPTPGYPPWGPLRTPPEPLRTPDSGPPRISGSARTPEIWVQKLARSLAIGTLKFPVKTPPRKPPLSGGGGKGTPLPPQNLTPFRGPPDPDSGPRSGPLRNPRFPKKVLRFPKKVPPISRKRTPIPEKVTSILDKVTRFPEN